MKSYNGFDKLSSFDGKHYNITYSLTFAIDVKVHVLRLWPLGQGLINIRIPDILVLLKTIIFPAVTRLEGIAF